MAAGCGVHLPKSDMNSPLRAHSVRLPRMAGIELRIVCRSQAATSINQGEIAMFRKITLALAATAFVATAAIPTAASASHWRDGWRHHHRHHHGASVRYYTPYYAYAA